MNTGKTPILNQRLLAAVVDVDVQKEVSTDESVEEIIAIIDLLLFKILPMFFYVIIYHLKVFLMLILMVVK